MINHTTSNGTRTGNRSAIAPTKELAVSVAQVPIAVTSEVSIEKVAPIKPRKDKKAPEIKAIIFFILTGITRNKCSTLLGTKKEYIKLFLCQNFFI